MRSMAAFFLLLPVIANAASSASSREERDRALRQKTTITSQSSCGSPAPP
jgi:uncharacterized membrane protein